MQNQTDSTCEMCGKLVGDSTPRCCDNDIRQRVQDLRSLQSISTRQKQELEKSLNKYGEGDEGENAVAAKIDRSLHQQEDLRLKLNEGMMLLVEKAVTLSKEEEALYKLRRIREQLENQREIQGIILHRLRVNLEESSMTLGLKRLQRAIGLFDMMNIEVNRPQQPIEILSSVTLAEEKQKPIVLTGWSSILGLPLQNSGVYVDTPPELVASAIAHIAYLVDSISAIMNVPTTHTINSFEAFDCSISANGDLSKNYRLSPATSMHTDFRCSWDVHQPASQAASKDSPGKEERGSNRTKKSKSSSQEKSEGENAWVPVPEFPTAVRMLQDNVVTLCITCGLDPAVLWPYEAVLLNLKELQNHFISMHAVKELQFQSGEIQDPAAVCSVLPSKCTLQLQQSLSSSQSGVGVAFDAHDRSDGDCMQNELCDDSKFGDQSIDRSGLLSAGSNHVVKTLLQRHRPERLQHALAELVRQSATQQSGPEDDDLEVVEHSNAWQGPSLSHTQVNTTAGLRIMEHDSEAGWAVVEDVL